MDWTLAGTVSEVRERLAAAVAEAGWRLDEQAAEPLLLRLRPARQTAAGAWGWLLLEAAGERVVVSGWLPDCEPTREALETALDRLACPGEERDDALLHRLKRIEGQVRGLHKMLASGRQCEAIMTQFAAVTSALKQSAALLVSTHMVTCLKDELDHGGDGSALNQKLLNILF